MLRTRLAWWIAGAVVLTLIVASAILLASDSVGDASTTPTVSAPEPPTAALDAARSLSDAFTFAAERVRPSVVNISTVREAEGAWVHGSPADPFREFFGDGFLDRFGLRPGPPGGRNPMQRSQGSGVIMEDGYILTNNHVVEGAEEITVRLPDDHTLVAEIIGTDPRTDLAVIRVDAEGLIPAAVGDSDALEVGDWVVAAGSPFGLTSSMTAGIISATGRANVGVADYEDFIQTDAAINPGNSGGPLVNLDGEVVGINTAIFTRSGGYMGIGFAIPINMARSIMDSLIENGHVSRGWLGIAIQDLDPGLAGSFGYEGDEGVLVSDVTPDSPAAEAGLQSGDIITSFDGAGVESVQRLRSQVADTRPGTAVEMGVFRDGRTRTLQVELGELEDSVTVARSPDAPPLDLGMSVRTLTPALARQLGHDSDLRGVLIIGVEPTGPAARANLRPNEIILEVQGRPVEDVEGFREAIDDADLTRGVRLTLQSGELRRFAFIQERDPVG